MTVEIRDRLLKKTAWPGGRTTRRRPSLGKNIALGLRLVLDEARGAQSRYLGDEGRRFQLALRFLEELADWYFCDDRSARDYRASGAGGARSPRP